MSKPLSIVIADDHPLLRKGLRQALESDRGIRVVYEADNGDDALEAIGRLRPDIAVLDIEMPKRGGFEVVEEINARGWETVVIFLTMYKEEMIVNKALDLGVWGYILKENAVTDLVQCVSHVLQGKHFVSSSLSDILLRRRKRGGSLSASPLNALTKSEIAVLRLVAELKTSRQIGDQLHISIKTVNNHRSNIAAKLGIRGAHALLKFVAINKEKIFSV
ncbi:MAG: response regulator transcription factor [Bacteroidota bacterium]